MFNIIPLIFILISFSVIIIIVVKKFSVLASLDVDNMQSEKEAKFKEKIISNRLKRNFYKYFNSIIKIIKPIFFSLKELLNKSYKKLISYKEEKEQEKEILKINKQGYEEKNIEKLFFEYNDFLKNNELEKAEKLLIKIIGIDSKNIDAFRKLGKLYFDKKSYQEAEQSLIHAFKLAETNAIEKLTNKNNLNVIKNNINYDDFVVEISFDLANLYKEKKNIKKAISYIDKSLLLEPNNPRYLDIKIELCILDSNKKLSLENYQILKKVNPDNKKLIDFKKRIDEIKI